MHPLRRTSWCLAAVMFLASSAYATITPSYNPPDLKTKIFDGEPTVEKSTRQKTATALAGIVRNTLSYTHKEDYQTASRLLGLALNLDPDNKEAIILNGGLEEKRIPEHHEGFSKDDALKQLHELANTLKDSKSKPDQTLAAYLYEAAGLVSPNDDDIYHFQLLKRAGIKADWAFADKTSPVARAGHEESTIDIKPITKINSLVVTAAADGSFHGGAAILIAAKSNRTGPFVKPQLLGTIGQEMRTALDEAIRLAEARHAGAAKAPIDISFEDKYSPKDGGSAGTAFTLLILAACGDLELNPHAAITGDITVDGKVQRVGMVAEKIRGAALDHAELVAIPSSDTTSLEDAILLRGPIALWETQIFGIVTLDDAIALLRIDPDPKITQAMTAFESLKKKYAGLAIDALPKNSDLKKSLEDILVLAPNHLSATYLLALTNGNKPTRLSLIGSITEAFAAVGPMRSGLVEHIHTPTNATDENLLAAQKNLNRIKAIADPAAEPLFAPLLEFCTIYASWGAAHRKNDIGKSLELAGTTRNQQKVVRDALGKVTSDREVIDRLMHR